MDKIELLPQTFFRFKCDRKILKETLECLKNEEWVSNSTNSKTLSDRLDKNTNYKKIFNWINKCLDDVKDELDLKCDKVRVVQSWANKAENGQWHFPHIHPNSYMSGILYLNDSDANTWFSVKNMWSYFNGDYYENLKIIYDQDKMRVIHKQKSVSGDLIIFPSNICHSVDEHKSEEPRYSISFNAFPCGKIGEFGYLSGLEISIK